MEEFQHLLIRLMSYLAARYCRVQFSQRLTFKGFGSFRPLMAYSGLLFSSCCHDIASEDPNTAAKKKSSTTTAMDGVKAALCRVSVESQSISKSSGSGLAGAQLENAGQSESGKWCRDCLIPRYPKRFFDHLSSPRF